MAESFERAEDQRAGEGGTVDASGLREVAAEEVEVSEENASKKTASRLGSELLEAEPRDNEVRGNNGGRDPLRRTKRRRRVTQAAPEGSDPHPFDPPVSPRSSRENDERLRADRPPHWG